MKSKREYNIIGRTEQGRVPIGKVTLEQGRELTRGEVYKTWSQVGLITIESDTLLYLYRNAKNDLMYLMYISGYFYPIHGRVLDMQGDIKLVEGKTAYFIDKNKKVKKIHRCYKYFVSMLDSYARDTMLVFKCTDRVQAEIVRDNAYFRGDMVYISVNKYIPHMSGKTITAEIYTKDTAPLWYEIGFFNKQLTSKIQSNKEG